MECQLEQISLKHDPCRRVPGWRNVCPLQSYPSSGFTMVVPEVQGLTCLYRFDDSASNRRLVDGGATCQTCNKYVRMESHSSTTTPSPTSQASFRDYCLWVSGLHSARISKAQATMGLKPTTKTWCCVMSMLSMMGAESKNRGIEKDTGCFLKWW